MNLENLGFVGWFRDKTDPEKQKEFSIARVVSVNKNSCLVSNGEKEVFAELSGKFIFNADSPLDYPTTGDFVYVQFFNDDSFAVIHEILPRKSVLERKTPGRKIDYQLIASNIDTALIVQSLDTNYNIRRLERYLIMINEGNISPLLLLSKADLLEPMELEKKKEDVIKLFPDLKVITFSNLDDQPLKDVRELFIPGKTFCLIGSSGVGKTTLLNKLLKDEAFETQPVREKDGRGRHTTTRRELVMLENGAMIIDTPGMRELGLIAAGESIEEYFSDVASLINNCRYSDCTHTREAGCAIQSAIENGELSRERFNSYLKLLKESEYHQMSYVEKRKKDRDFGKMVKSILKDHPKK